MMTPARFGVQFLVIGTLIVLVSWPQHRQLRAVTVWRTNGPVAGNRDAADRYSRLAAKDAQRGRYEIGFGSAAYSASGSASGNALTRKLFENDVERRRFTTPAAVRALGGRINAIIGRARTALNTPVPYARLLLRNIATGQVEARATADEAGRFVFLDVIPSGYVVELIGPDGSVIAASEFVPVALGDLRETTVRVSGPQSLLGTFGSFLAGTANEPVTAAAASGVSRVAQPERTASPVR